MRPRLLSVILTTYNWPQALDRALAALADQTSPSFEVIVADDGSGPETAALIRDWQDRCPVPLQRVWHPDEGFRAARIRNLAVAKSRGDYLLFTDGDCLARPDWIARHAELAEGGWYVTGRRAYLTTQATETVLRDRPAIHAWPLDRWRREGRRLLLKPSYVDRLRPLPLGPLRKRQPHETRTVETCNLGLWRSDFLRVAGFDEGYRQFGHEDVDLAVRLQRAGVRRKSGENAVTVLHLDHPRRSFGEDSETRLAAVRAQPTLRPSRSVFLEQAA